MGLLEIYGLIGLLAILVARFVPLARWVPGWQCLVRRYLGIPCPTCGTTRAFDWFAQGRLLDALRINPLAFALACLCVVGVLYFIAVPLRPPKLQVTLTPRAGTVVRVGAVAIVAANWVYMLVRSLLGG